ncbi:MAG: DinB family protein [Planctomycetota bacterium]|jgi:uncharacterized damage-inducible protein DinB
MNDPQTPMETPTAITWALETFLGAKPGWEHPSFNSLVAPLTAQQAAWRPGPGRHSIWKLVRHMTHWRICTLAEVQYQPLPNGPEDWSSPPESQDEDDLERAWQAEVQRYCDTTKEIIEVVRDLDLTKPHPHPRMTHVPLWMAVVGMQIHDSYHLGQISLLRRMQGFDPVE